MLQVTPDRIEAICRGNNALFDEIVLNWRDELLSVAFHYLGNWNDAEDVAQTTLIRAYRSLRRYDSSKPFHAWLFGIHLNCCRSYWRRERFRRMLFKPFEQDEDAGAEDRHTDSLELEIIQKALKSLSWKQQTAFILMEIEDKDSREAGELMRCSASTARVHLGRAKENLQEALKKVGIDHEPRTIHRAASAG